MDFKDRVIYCSQLSPKMSMATNKRNSINRSDAMEREGDARQIIVGWQKIGRAACIVQFALAFTL